MCGIFFSLIYNPDNFDTNHIDFELLKKRGPDSFETRKISTNDFFELIFSSSVLSLRGNCSDQVTKQPLVDNQKGNILLWNGEIFSSDLIKVENDENDGWKLLHALSEKSFSQENLFKLFESIKGPYAFVFYERASNNIYFGRDRLGRRSLLISVNNDFFKSNSVQENNKNIPVLTLSSVKIKNKMNENFFNEFEELKANGIYKLNLSNKPILELYEWNRLNFISKLDEKNDEEYPQKATYMSSLINTTLINDSCISPFNDIVDNIDENTNFNELVEEFYSKLKESVMRRVKNIPNNCKACSRLDIPKGTVKFTNSDSKKCDHAKLAILFSGGVDSAVLAALADECIPQEEQIDLLNIAFENPKSKDLFMVPDRISGIETLKQLNSKRKWNFVEINISLDELKKERESLIRHLLYPHQTVLDDSIGCALWFASRGKGLNNKNEFQSNAEVLLLGMGADEQLAGYSRHRSCFENNGLISLCNEIKMEMNRISERNLGRDDRILSDHGKESRLPFLDEDLISFLNQLKINQKCNMKLPRGQGEKYLLRRLASTKLGLSYAAGLQKRAIQFGSRIAKIENGKEKAGDVCDRIKAHLN